MAGHKPVERVQACEGVRQPPSGRIIPEQNANSLNEEWSRVDEGHIAEWPDKILFSGMTLAMAATLGILFDIGRLVNISVDVGWLQFLDTYPAALSILFNVIALGFAVLAIRAQAWLPAFISACFAILSMGFLFITPLLALAAMGFMVRAKIEGEECTWDEHMVGADLWPDKAIAAAMILATGGIITIIHGTYLLAGQMEPLYSAGTFQGVVSLIFGLAILAGARETFLLRRPWAGNTAALLCFVGAGFYFLAPVLGVAGFMLIGFAAKESEFTS